METGDGETDTDAEGDDEGDEVQLQEIWPALTRFGNLLERVKRVLLGPKTASRGEDEEESAALLCGDSRDSVETEGAEDAVLTGDLSLNLEAVVVTGGTVGDCAEPLVLRSEDVDKPLPPPPLAGDGNPADI